ncbi:MAG: hypothetical protein AAF937_04595 [Planctomycetota bacterium]
MTRIASIAAVLAFAGSASAQFAPGSLLFISDDRDGGADSVNALDYNSLSVTNLFNFAAGGQDVARHGGLAQGPDGEFYVGNSPLPNLDPSTASLERLDGLFSGAPVQSTAVSAPSLQNTTGVIYDSFTDSLLVLNNPGSAFPVPREFEGLQSYDRATGAYDGLVVPEDFAMPGIGAVGGGLVAAGSNPGEYFFGSINGGVGFDPTLPGDGSRTASVIARTQLNDPANPLDDTTEVLVDLTPADSGADEFLGLLRGLAVLPNGNIAFLEGNSSRIWEVVLDGNGDFDSLNIIFDGDGIAGDDRALGSGIIYNQFTDKLNYIENTDTLGVFNIVEINTDGTGRTILASGLTNVNSLVAIPAPASAALLGLGGLAAARRRR